MYNVESVFNLQDKVSPALKKLIENLDKADAQMKKFQARLMGTNALLKITAERAILTGQAFGAMGRAVAQGGKAVNVFDTQAKITNAELQTMGARGIIAGRSFQFLGQHARTASNHLGGTNSRIQQTGAQAERALKHVNLLHHAMSGFGRGVGMGMGMPFIGGSITENVGMAAAGLAAGSIKGGAHYQQSLSQLEMSQNLSPKQEKQAEAVARQMTRAVPTLRLHEALDIIKTSMSITGDPAHGMEAAPLFARAALAMKGLGGAGQNTSSIEDNVRSLEKAFEKRGVLLNPKTGQFDEEHTKTALTQFLRAKAANPMLSAEAYGQALNTMGAARYGLESDFGRTMFPITIAEYSRKTGALGGSIGPALSQMEANFGTGRASGDLMGHMQKIGWLPTKTTQGKELKPKDMQGHMLELLQGGGKKFAEDIKKGEYFEAAQDLKAGALQYSGKEWDKMNPHERASMMQNFMGKAGSAGNPKQMASLMTEYATDEARYRKEAANNQKLLNKGLDDFANQTLKQTTTKMESVQAAWDNFNETLGKNPLMVRTVSSALDGMVRALNNLSDFTETFGKRFPATAAALEHAGDALNIAFTSLGNTMESVWKSLSPIIEAASKWANENIPKPVGDLSAAAVGSANDSGMAPALMRFAKTHPGLGKKAPQTAMGSRHFVPPPPPDFMGIGDLAKTTMQNATNTGNLLGQTLMDQFQPKGKGANRLIPPPPPILLDPGKFPNPIQALGAPPPPMFGSALSSRKNRKGKGLTMQAQGLPIAGAGVFDQDSIPRYRPKPFGLAEGLEAGQTWGKAMNADSQRHAAPIHIEQHFHGPTTPEQVKQATARAASEALMKSSLNHSVTAQGAAGGNVNTPQLNGRSM